MEEKNQLNDIILDKSSSSNNNKKIVLAVATLGIILIIVVVLMNSLTSNGTDNLPQPLLPEPLLAPEAKSKTAYNSEYDEPLFEEVEIVDDIDEDLEYNQNLSQIAQKLKQESLEEEIVAVVAAAPVVKSKPVISKHYKPVPAKKVVVNKEKKTINKTLATGRYFIQVGSFSTYEPNKKFLKSITDKGYSYKYHKVTVKSKSINKILVGPFGTERDARVALRSVRRDIVAGAFLTKI